ncbi:MAG TPA: hypothetical protein VN939_00065, partial [Chthoniobacterales bacterium]|nr:hypothetical protein [Chthoniobacterales bacterium]
DDNHRTSSLGLRLAVCSVPSTVGAPLGPRLWIVPNPRTDHGQPLTRLKLAVGAWAFGVWRSVFGDRPSPEARSADQIVSLG